MWDVDTETGRELFGPDYLDVYTIDMFHQIGASDIECDHLHGKHRSESRISSSLA